MEFTFDDRLKEEELLYGFEISNTEDESFLLDNGVKYPGKLPYNLTPNEIKDAEASEKLIKEFLQQQNTDSSKSEQNKGTVWHLFEDADSEFLKSNITDEFETNENLNSSNSLIDEPEENPSLNNQPFEDEINEPPKLSNFDVQDNSESNSNEINHSEDNNDIYPAEKETSSNEIQNEENNEVKLDEALLGLIQGDLNKSLLKKTNNDISSNESFSHKNTSNDDFTDFKPVDELEDSILIEFDSIGVNKPSEFKEDKNKVKSQPTKKLKPIKQKKEKKKKEKPEKEKKRKITLPPLPWKKISFAAATVLIFGGIFLLGYYLFFIDPETQNQINQVKAFKNKSKQPAIDSIANNYKESNHSVTVPILDTTTKINLSDENKENTNSLLNINNEDKIKPRLENTPRTLNYNKPKPPLSRKIPPKNTNLNNNSLRASEERLYVIEVFSSPVKEEAEKWLIRLHVSNIKDGVIRTQKVREDIWYRVRFGNFSSFDEAKNALKKIGLKNARIDRVK